MGVHSDARPGMARKREWSGKVIQFENVGLRYGLGPEVLSDLTFDVHPNSFQFLTGPSGAGKTSLLRLMLMSLKPTRGVVRLFGREAASIPRNAMPGLRRKIGVVFQDFRLVPHLSAFDNVALPLVIAGCEHREVGRRVRAALDKVGLLDRERAMPVTLSGGEQQRVGIARAVVGKPQVLLADEPTGNLDPALSAEIMQLFEEFNQVGVTVLIASHDLVLISRLHHRIITLRNGRLVGGSSS